MMDFTWLWNLLVLSGMFLFGASVGFVGAFLVARNNINQAIEILQINPNKKSAEDFIKEKLAEVFNITLK